MGTHHQTQQQQQQSSNNSNAQQLSLEHISKFFNLPLSDAADSLGVCNSTLKKICHDNGLVRWPYRKFLSGKSIEDIIKEAARERKMGPAELLKATKDRKDDMTKITVSSVGSTLQNKTSTPVQGNRNIHNATPGIVDEFKYGFPSDGLSRTSNKWWGSSTTGSKKDVHGREGEANRQDEEQSEKPLSDGPSKDKVDSQSGTDDTNTPPKLSGTRLLSAVRKRAVKEGQEALNLGVHRFSGINKPGKREKALLYGIFGSSLPKEWRDGSS